MLLFSCKLVENYNLEELEKVVIFQNWNLEKLYYIYMWQLKTQLLTYILGIYCLGLATYYNENEHENEKQTVLYCILFKKSMF